MTHAQLEIFGLNRFHNSIPLKGEELDKAEKKATTQEEIILDFMASHPHQSFTPAEIQLLFGQKWPLTSVRARMTTLTKKGLLEITDQQRPGLYGMLNNTWRIKPKTPCLK